MRFDLLVLLALSQGCVSGGDAAAGSSQQTPTNSSAASARSPVDSGIGAGASSATTGTLAVDQSTPEKAVSAIFEAGKRDDPSGLAALCDDGISKDHDVRLICGFKKGDKVWDAAKGDSANARITGTKVDGDWASVDFTWGADGSKKETIQLKKLGEKWYLAKM